MNPPAISIRNLSKSYGSVHAVRDVSLDVERGESLESHALVGYLPGELGL